MGARASARAEHGGHSCQGSRASSNARRVRLDLSECPEFALFPGQVIGAVGVNPMGHSILAKRILPVLPPGPICEPVTNGTPQRKLEQAPAAGEAATLLVASGPYTTTDDLTYVPLADLLAAAVAASADAVVLLGALAATSTENGGQVSLGARRGGLHASARWASCLGEVGSRRRPLLRLALSSTSSAPFPEPSLNLP